MTDINSLKNYCKNNNLEYKIETYNYSNYYGIPVRVNKTTDIVKCKTTVGNFEHYNNKYFLSKYAAELDSAHNLRNKIRKDNRSKGKVLSEF